MNTPLDIQLEFLDYKIGQFIYKYNGYYIGNYDNRIILINTIREYNHRIIENYYTYNLILDKYKFNKNSLSLPFDYKIITINEFLRFKNDINNIVHLCDHVFVGESQIYDRFTNKFHNVVKPKSFYKRFNSNIIAIKYL